MRGNNYLTTDVKRPTNSPHYYLLATIFLYCTVGNPYVFTKIFLKISGRYALVMFSFVYLAGIVAAIYQLVTGSSRKAFPRLLNRWLSIRKHLGLIALWMTIQHIIVSCFLAVPGNFIDVGLKGVSTSMNRLVSFIYNDHLSLSTPVVLYSNLLNSLFPH